MLFPKLPVNQYSLLLNSVTFPSLLLYFNILLVISCHGYCVLLILISLYSYINLTILDFIA